MNAIYYCLKYCTISEQLIMNLLDASILIWQLPGQRVSLRLTIYWNVFYLYIDSDVTSQKGMKATFMIQAFEKLKVYSQGLYL